MLSLHQRSIRSFTRQAGCWRTVCRENNSQLGTLRTRHLHLVQVQGRTRSIKGFPCGLRGKNYLSQGFSDKLLDKFFPVFSTTSYLHLYMVQVLQGCFLRLRSGLALRSNTSSTRSLLRRRLAFTVPLSRRNKLFWSAI
jgi:hypothetical protein